MLTDHTVPDNVDYNSLKHEIKAHTTRDQARAIAIPGQEDKRLARFENGLYAELCRQHSRLGLFVATKSGELMRKLGACCGVICYWHACPRVVHSWLADLTKL